MIAHISGHLDVTNEEFKEHYIQKIEDALKLHHTFVVGDAKGADLMAIEFLDNKILIPDELVVYHMFDFPRNNIEKFCFSMIGGYQSDEERDAAMTRISDYDIAWIRPGRENSCTANNLKRRKLYEKS